jgi:hypothetical protein
MFPAPVLHTFDVLASVEISLTTVLSEPFLPGCFSAGPGAFQIRAKAMAFAEAGIDHEALTTMGASAGTR